MRSTLIKETSNYYQHPTLIDDTARAATPRSGLGERRRYLGVALDSCQHQRSVAIPILHVQPRPRLDQR